MPKVDIHWISWYELRDFLIVLLEFLITTTFKIPKLIYIFLAKFLKVSLYYFTEITFKLKKTNLGLEEISYDSIILLRPTQENPFYWCDG